MIEEFRFPTKQALIDIQRELIEAYGGLPGLKNEELLEQSLAHPKQILAYGLHKCSISELAVSLCRNRAFNDGNKRISFTALGLTLALNGLYLDVSEREAAKVMCDLAAGNISEQDFTAWTSANSYESDI